jgi:predicted ArsR family transcriptional regulator
MCKIVRVSPSASPADALAQPTRARLFSLLEELQRPASTDELAATLELHPNGVRVHLERLQDAGLVVRSRERRPRGRPRDSWVIAPDAGPAGDSPTAYADLSRWLVRGISSSQTRVTDVEATGREIGRELVDQDAAGPPAQQMQRALAGLGFRPRREPSHSGELIYTLANCPYRDAVRENQPIVCALHRGLTRGLLDQLSPDTELIAFVPHDPYAAGCKIQLRGPLSEDTPKPEGH